ncbi:MAG: cytochrome c-type biogenesis protein [Chloroflexota bacterium]
MKLSRVWFCLVVALAIVATSVGSALAQSAESLDAEARAIAKDLQCPICSGQSVADSGSQLARDMRVIIRQKLGEGESRQQIINYLVDRYGEAILREPIRGGFNDLLWWLPAIGVTIGGILIGYFVYRWQRDRKVRAAIARRTRAPDLSGYERQFESEIEEEPW